MSLTDQEKSQQDFNLAALRDYAYRKLGAEHWEKLSKITNDIRQAKEKETREHYTHYQKRVQAEIHNMTKEGTSRDLHLRPTNASNYASRMADIKKLAREKIDATHKGRIEELKTEERDKIRSLLKEEKPTQERVKPSFNQEATPNQTRTRRRSR